MSDPWESDAARDAYYRSIHTFTPHDERQGRGYAVNTSNPTDVHHTPHAPDVYLRPVDLSYAHRLVHRGMRQLSPEMHEWMANEDVPAGAVPYTGHIENGHKGPLVGLYGDTPTDELNPALGGGIQINVKRYTIPRTLLDELSKPY